jgi:hypothetical protein
MADTLEMTTAIQQEFFKIHFVTFLEDNLLPFFSETS